MVLSAASLKAECKAAVPLCRRWRRSRWRFERIDSTGGKMGTLRLSDAITHSNITYPAISHCVSLCNKANECATTERGQSSVL